MTDTYLTITEFTEAVTEHNSSLALDDSRRHVGAAELRNIRTVSSLELPTEPRGLKLGEEYEDTEKVRAFFQVLAKQDTIDWSTHWNTYSLATDKEAAFVQICKLVQD